MNEELKFSDFLTSKHEYGHTKEDVWEAVGATEKDVEELRVMIKAIFEDSDKYPALSNKVEAVLKIDRPLPWIATALLKAGSGCARGYMAKIIMSAPDELPTPILKATLLMAVTQGGPL